MTIVMQMALAVAAVGLAVPAAAHAGEAAGQPVLRVCADPNNWPFSNARGEGLENQIAQRLAHALGAEVSYTWWPQRRGFIRNTLRAGRCDVIVGVPAGLEMVAHTRPYYRSTFVFATRPGLPPVRSLDDPRLRRLRVGIPLVGDDGSNPPPEAALARRGIVDNVVGFSVYGDYAQPNPPLAPLEALARGDVDVVAVWGPLAGAYARQNRVALAIAPVAPARDRGVPFAFAITVGVRPGDEALRRRLDEALRAERHNIERILDEYGVPRT